MQIEVSITVKNIPASDYTAAKRAAYAALDPWQWAQMVNVFSEEEFINLCRCYRNTDQTYTVTLP